MNIDWTKVPRHTVDIGKLNDPFDLTLIFKKLNITKYVYTIKYKGMVVKVGMSADNSRTLGERAYRQIGHSESWGDRRLNGSSGSDWRIVEEEFYKRYGTKINKDDLEIIIHDFTGYPFTTMNPWNEVYYAEQERIEQYKDFVGEKPIGNVHDDENFRRRGHIPKKNFDGLFELAY